MLRESLFWAHTVFYGVLYHVRQLSEHVLGEWALRPGTGAPAESMHALNFTSFPRQPPAPPTRLVAESTDNPSAIQVLSDAQSAGAAEQQRTDVDMNKSTQKEQKSPLAHALVAEKTHMSDASSSATVVTDREESDLSAQPAQSDRSKQLIESVPTLDQMLEQQTIALTRAHTEFQSFHKLVSQITAEACMVFTCLEIYSYISSLITTLFQFYNNKMLYLAFCQLNEN